MKKVVHADSNLLSVYAAINYMLNKSANSLTIWPENACSVRVSITKDMFGYFGGWEHLLNQVYMTTGSKVYTFDPHEYERFNDYLFYDAFKEHWKKIIPYHYITEFKQILRELYRNASKHSHSNNPIFISSGFEGEFLRFTIVDCGVGFLSNMEDREEVVCESEAIQWALNGGNSRASANRSLKGIGRYCCENEGEMLVISGGTAVYYGEDRSHIVNPLPGIFRGSIINISVKIKRVQFTRLAA
ncbi:MAG TPA: ATP-binding protein [Cyclobacteriaceae bacterium]|nr:ATP-binding protein [Cyclobacteriaceae bacterium]HRK55683.1 ATP-binding protein [Cyclobacteriaceae bacterium]